MRLAPSSTACSAAAHKVTSALFEGDTHVRGPRFEKNRKDRDAKILQGLGENLGKILVGEHGLLELEQPALLGGLGEQVALAPETAHQGHHQLFADGIDRRIGDLGELLLEVPKEWVRSARSTRRAARRSPCFRWPLLPVWPWPPAGCACPPGCTRTRAATSVAPGRPTEGAARPSAACEGRSCCLRATVHRASTRRPRA
jgi:hypothetical protein